MAFPGNAVDKLVAKVEVNFGRENVTKTIHSGGTATVTVDNQILEWVNEWQEEVCRRADFWFLHVRGQTATLSSGSGTVALASDFKDLDDPVWYLDSATNTFVELESMSLIDYRRQHDDTTTGSPSEYDIEGTNLIIRPIADADYTMYYDYWKYLADLTAGGSSNTLVTDYPKVLECGATAMAFESVDQLENASYWWDKAEKYVQQLISFNADRELPDELEVKPRPDVKGTGITKIVGR